MQRLGLDIGTNSIGWWLHDLADDMPHSVVDGGVRIFSDGRDPQSKESLAVDRRIARGMRRRRDRYLRRRASLMSKLAAAGLMPSDPVAAKALELLDPYELRARGLDKPLALIELERCFTSINDAGSSRTARPTRAIMKVE